MLSDAQIVPTIPITDLERARAFYEGKLGLQPIEGLGPKGSLAYQCGKGSAVVLYRRGPTNPPHTLAAFLVSDVRAEVVGLRSRGVEFEEYDLPGLKTEQGIATLESEIAAWFKDPDGNILSIAQVR